MRLGGRNKALALVGPTASGKSELAFSLAVANPGTHLVSVDSMCVYRGMDIGTAKPTASEQRAVQHHLLDLVDPWETFTVGQFRRAACDALAAIEAVGGRALLVGGSGLYMRAVVDGLEIPGRWPEVAADLDEQAAWPGGLARLYTRLSELDPVAASRMEPTNRRRVLRALEVTLGSGRPFSSFGPGLSAYQASGIKMVGIRYEPEIHRRRIEERFGLLMERGFLEEVRSLAAGRGLSRTARQALGYRELLTYLEGQVSLGDAVNQAIRRTAVFARRQWAWFRRDPRIRWLDPRGDLAGALAEEWEELGAVGD